MPLSVSDMRGVYKDIVLLLQKNQYLQSWQLKKKVSENNLYKTVKPVLSDDSKLDETKILVTNDSLMKVKNIAECSMGSILQ